MPPNTPEGRIRIIAENLARAALAEMQRDVQGAGKAATGASVGFEKMVFQHGQLIASTQGARRGLNIVENGLRTLAFQAAGLPGPLGKVAAGVGLLGAGSLVVTSAVAGIGAIAMAYKFASAQADNLRLSNEKLAQTWRDVAARGKPLVALANDLQRAIDAETEAQDKLDRLTALLPGGGEGGAPKTIGDEGEIALARTGLSQAQANVAQMRTLVREARVQLAADVQAAGVKTAQQFVENIKHLGPQLQLELLRLGERQFGPQFERLGGESGTIFGKAWLAAAEAMLDQGLDPLGRRLGVGAPRGLERFPTSASGKLEPATSPAFKPEKFEPREFFISDMEKAIVKAQPAKPDAARLAAEAVALLGALKQGGAVGILGAAGGAVSELSRLKGLGGLGPIGIGLSVASGIFGLFDRSAERRHREELDELRRIRENTDKRGQPDHISVTVLVNGREISAEVLPAIMYGIRRAERTNAVPVLPPS